jgi:Carboxypeptidase regulatory-like domain/TonB dependent receptor/TonB-dependent Receptor Plug Domain
MRFPRSVRLYVFFTLSTIHLLAQSPDGNINGLVSDPSSAAVVGAEVVVVNDVTRVQYTTKTNNEGIYLFSSLPPGPYRLQVSKIGFKTIVKPDIILNVQDALSINFTLPVGAFHEVLTVEGGASLVNTESAAVSTVVDRGYVENMPLNGRSFQDLILLTPGVVTTTPQVGAATGSAGEFSVNGQRTESNYYTVDGVSANVGVNAGSAAEAGTSGSLSAPTALGTTQGLVSVDALEEFRVQSSTYSAEYGRNPGGQFSFLTRSGTNELHGTAFDYLRNSVFDSNDWFNDYFGQPEASLRQNDFGGTLGGPIKIPYLYSGIDKTFFFFSYEGLRLDQPQAANVTYVPDAYLRACSPTSIQQVMNAFPQPTASGPLPNCANPDPGSGLTEFIGAWSNPSSIDATSIRLDHTVTDKLRLFFRFANTSSDGESQQSGTFGVASDLSSIAFTTRTYTFGATSAFSNNINNEFRLNYSSNSELSSVTPINYAGAAPVDLFQLQGVGSGAEVHFLLLLGGAGTPILIQNSFSGLQRQWNLVESLVLSRGRHQLKFGLDYRRLEPRISPSNPVAAYDYFSEGSILSNSVDYGFGQSSAIARPAFSNFSVFAQDEWRLKSRLTLSVGLRWEVNPAPTAAKGNLPYTVSGSTLESLTVAPEGTPLWKTDWFNFAPRLGVAYVMRSEPGFETVIRGGAGVFFDTGQQLGASGYNGPGFSALTTFGSLSGSPASFPVAPAEVSPAIVNPPVAPYGTIYAFPAHLQLPYTLQWNLSLQQALEKSQAVTLSYVGSHASRLLEQNEVNVQPFNPNFGTVFFNQNGLTSDYDAFQAQFQRRLSRGLQALASYTWSHSIDYGSFNLDVPYRRGNSDFDVRHNLSGALTYDIPSGVENRFARAVVESWSIDDRFTVRTAFPVLLQGVATVDPATGSTYFSGLNTVAGQQIYVSGIACAEVYANGLGCPGGRAINPDAFSLPVGCTSSSCEPGTAAGDAPRNFTRGFGAWQMDLALRRELRIYERLKLQFRAEAFNLFNHPNFGIVNANYCSAGAGTGCTFGQVTSTLANSLGGLSPLYQMGGARSMQFALKLVF